MIPSMLFQQNAYLTTAKLTYEVKGFADADSGATRTLLMKNVIMLFVIVNYHKLVWSPNGIFGWNSTNQKIQTFFAEY